MLIYNFTFERSVENFIFFFVTNLSPNSRDSYGCTIAAKGSAIAANDILWVCSIEALLLRRCASILSNFQS
jgi:hypothetical protein